jgi:tryptophan-rich sensory protein
MNGPGLWYDGLKKPSWTLSPTTIGAIWTVIYPLIAVAAVATAFKAWKGELSRWVLLPLALNLVANAAFTPIEFGLHDLSLALADIVLVLVTIVAWMALTWRPGSIWIAAVLAPYLIWVSIATVLQVSITFMNR